MARVLVASGSHATRTYVRDVLEYDGHRVREASTMSEVLAACQEARPAVLLLDPDLEGSTVPALRQLVRARLHGAPRLVFLGEDGDLDLEALRARVDPEADIAHLEDAVQLLREVEHEVRPLVDHYPGEPELAVPFAQRPPRMPSMGRSRTGQEDELPS